MGTARGCSSRSPKCTCGSRVASRGIRVDWFTLLFEVIQLDSLAIIIVVASLNWCDEAHSQATRFALKLTRELFVISITLPNLLSDHLTNTFDCYKANQC